MLKIVGSAAVILCGSILGILKCKELYKRADDLYSAENALIYMQNEISLSSGVIKDILAQSGYTPFKKAALYTEDMGCTAAVKKAIEECDLQNEELTAFGKFADGMCAMDKEGQIRNIHLCLENIKQIKEKAILKREKLGKLYAVSGVLISTAAVLVFI